MIEVSVRTRSGCSMAMAWAIIPPIEAPTMCADGEPEGVEQADRVGGHVGQEVRHLDRLALRRGQERVRNSTSRPSTLVERPTSRLS